VGKGTSEGKPDFGAALGQICEDGIGFFYLADESIDRERLCGDLLDATREQAGLGDGGGEEFIE
jgi:hypothetical protein